MTSHPTGAIPKTRGRNTIMIISESSSDEEYIPRHRRRPTTNRSQEHHNLRSTASAAGPSSSSSQENQHKTKRPKVVQSASLPSRSDDNKMAPTTTNNKMVAPVKMETHHTEKGKTVKKKLPSTTNATSANKENVDIFILDDDDLMSDNVQPARAARTQKITQYPSPIWENSVMEVQEPQLPNPNLNYPSPYIYTRTITDGPAFKPLKTRAGGSNSAPEPKSRVGQWHVKTCTCENCKRRLQNQQQQETANAAPTTRRPVSATVTSGALEKENMKKKTSSKDTKVASGPVTAPTQGQRPLQEQNGAPAVNIVAPKRRKLPAFAPPLFSDDSSFYDDDEMVGAVALPPPRLPCGCVKHSEDTIHNLLKNSGLSAEGERQLRRLTKLTKEQLVEETKNFQIWNTPFRQPCRYKLLRRMATSLKDTEETLRQARAKAKEATRAKRDAKVALDNSPAAATKAALESAKAAKRAAEKAATRAAIKKVIQAAAKQSAARQAAEAAAKQAAEAAAKQAAEAAAKAAAEAAAKAAAEAAAKAAAEAAAAKAAREKAVLDELAADERDRETMCIICCETPRECVFVPCYHYICCLQCGRNKKIRHCPVCRGKIDKVKQIHKA